MIGACYKTPGCGPVAILKLFEAFLPGRACTTTSFLTPKSVQNTDFSLEFTIIVQFWSLPFLMMYSDKPHKCQTNMFLSYWCSLQICPINGKVTGNPSDSVLAYKMPFFEASKFCTVHTVY